MKTTKEIEVIIDDLDKTTEAVETIKFSVNGTSYEIDLSERSLRRFELALAPFVNAARSESKAKPKTAAKRSTKRRPAKKTGPSDAIVRTWAHANGVEVNKTGRVPKAVREAFEASLVEHEEHQTAA